ncbi:MAG: cobalamin B12-binding domain-containing protein, partial [Geopsychrobacter sp.]|nr:cobalamin B12-binding domain-containing protein [Geopsychrobacter sp.]
MDILIVKPGNQKQLYGELDAYNLTAYEPPLWSALLAGYLRQQRVGVELLDAEIEHLSFVETAQRINELKPRLAVISVSGTNPSASTMNMSGAEEIIRELSQLNPQIKTLLHGLHPSALPKRTLEESAVDYVCQGEGFSTVRQLIEALRVDGCTQGIAGLWQRDGVNVVSAIAAELFVDLDLLPSP